MAARRWLHCLSAYLVLEKTYLQLGPALIVQATFLRVALAFSSYPLDSRAMLPFQRYPQETMSIQYWVCFRGRDVI